MQLSVVVPLYNEQDNIQPLIDAVAAALSSHGPYELILVDDGSNDKTVANIRTYANAQTVLVVLNQNYGQSIAMSVGFSVASAQWVVCMDGDLQNDPQDIPAMLAKAQQDHWDVVLGVRRKRQDFWLRCLPSRCANIFIRWLTGVTSEDAGCTLKLMRADVIQQISLYGELHRFIPVLLAMTKARVTQMPVRHHARMRGESKYESGWTGGVLRRTVAVLGDLVWLVFWRRYRDKPMHFFGALGFGCYGGALLLLCLAMSLVWFNSAIAAVLLYALLFWLVGTLFIGMGLLAQLQLQSGYAQLDLLQSKVSEVQKFVQ